MNQATSNAQDRRRLDLVLYGATRLGDLRAAAERKHRVIYPEFPRAWRCRLTVLAPEIGRRWTRKLRPKCCTATPRSLLRSVTTADSNRAADEDGAAALAACRAWQALTVLPNAATFRVALLRSRCCARAAPSERAFVARLAATSRKTVCPAKTSKVSKLHRLPTVPEDGSAATGGPLLLPPGLEQRNRPGQVRSGQERSATSRVRDGTPVASRPLATLAITVKSRTRLFVVTRAQASQLGSAVGEYTRQEHTAGALDLKSTQTKNTSKNLASSNPTHTHTSFCATRSPVCALLAASGFTQSPQACFAKACRKWARLGAPLDRLGGQPMLFVPWFPPRATCPRTPVHTWFARQESVDGHFGP